MRHAAPRPLRLLPVLFPALLAAGPAPAEHSAKPAAPAALPSFVVLNGGQEDPGVLFRISWPGGILIGRASELVFVTPASAQPGERPGSASHLDANGAEKAPPSDSQAVRVRRLRFEGTSPGVSAAGLDRLPGILNVFRGSDPSRWHTRIPIYSGVVCRDLYPGIDLKLDVKGGRLGGTFLLAPGADPSRVRWRWAEGDGTTGEEAGAAGSTAVGAAVPDAAVKGFRLDAGTRQGPDILVDASSLLYGTYLGGSGFELAYAIAADSSGSAYLTGYTLSTDFPTAGPIDPTCGTDGTCDGGSTDVFVAKLDTTQPGAASLVYATYLGGSGNDYGVRIALDGNGAAYVVGLARAGFPTTGNAFQPTFGSSTGLGADAFLSKLGADGASLLYSTYFGGSSGDGAWGLAVDGSGGAWLAGQTYSTDFPTTTGVYATTCGCDGSTTSDAFAARLDTTLSGSASLVFSTYLGGSGVDQGFDVALGPGGTVYVAGRTLSTDFPTAGAYQGSGGADWDAFVSKLSADATGLLYSTYLGGGGYDDGYTVAADSSGRAYVTGTTGSGDFPTSAGAFQGTFGGVFDAWFARLDPAASGAPSLLYATYVGGTGDDEGYGLAVDGAGRGNLAGFTASTDFPVTACTFQKASGGGYDAFVVRIDPAAPGAASLFSSGYFGGSDTDAVYGLALGTDGSLYLAGQTSSTNLPTAAAYSGNLSGGTDALIARLKLPDTPPTPTASNTGPYCEGATILLSTPDVAGAAYAWTGPIGFASALRTPTIPGATIAASGLYGVTVTAGGCTSAAGVTAVDVEAIPAAPAVTAPATVGEGSPNRTASVPFHAGSAWSWTIGNGTIGSGQGTSTITFTAGAAGTPLTLSVTETTAAGCLSAAGHATVTVAPPGSALLFYAVAPCRKLDTRAGPGTPLAANESRTVALSGAPCGIPAAAKSVSANVTVTRPQAPGFLTAWPADETRPLASTLNYSPGQTRASNAILPLSADGAGQVRFFNGSVGTLDLIVDVNGYFQ